MGEKSFRSGRFGSATVALAAAAVAALAAALQALLMALERSAGGRILWGDEIFYFSSARQLLQTGRSDLDPLWPPLYPHLLAALGGSRGAIAVVQILLLFAAAALLGDFARRAYGGGTGVLAGLLAGGLLLLDPQVAAFSHFLWPEILHLFLFVAVLWGLLLLGDGPVWLAQATAGAAGAHTKEHHHPNHLPWIAMALLGAACGIALQAKSLLLPFVPVLFWPVLRRLGPRRGVLCALIAAASLAVTLTPTLLANEREGIGFRLADSARFNLWVGLNDTSRRNLVGEIVGHEYDLYRRSAPTFAARNAILGDKIHRLMTREGWFPLALRQLGRQPFRLLDRASFFTDQLPGGAIAAEGRGYRGVAPSLAATLGTAASGIYGLALLAGIVGIARGRAAWAPGAAGFRPVLLVFLGYNLLLFLALHVKTRYRVQIMPVLDLFAAFGLAGLWEGARLSRRATVGAVAAALVVLGLAFGGRALDARWPQESLEPLPALPPRATASSETGR